MTPEFLPTTPEGKLEHLIEECAEMILAAQKLKRFGPTNNANGVTYHNAEHLFRELFDLERAITSVFLSH